MTEMEENEKKGVDERRGTKGDKGDNGEGGDSR
jgi:hypothetical protein